MKRLCLFMSLMSVVFVCGQDIIESEGLGNWYLEDQLYLGVTYNFVGNTPDGLKQQNLSYGFQLGAIKDIPLNIAGTRAIGIGAGLALNSYFSNLLAKENATGISYSLADNVVGFKRSKIETHLVELPLEFRWRNSTAEDYRFWRLYAGVKFAYLLGARSKSLVDGVKEGFRNTDITRLQYGPTLNVGYNTFNIHVYYALNNLFQNSAQLNNQDIGFSPLKVGVIFYIL